MLLGCVVFSQGVRNKKKERKKDEHSTVQLGIRNE
jgi:hypothetical protein